MGIKIEKAVTWAIAIAEDKTHGYDQKNRWGPNYDCSGLVISAYEQAGVPVKTKGAIWTGNMPSVFKTCGFKDVTKNVKLKTGEGLKRGDVLICRGTHTAMYIGDGKMVHAQINEKGTVKGGCTGDQTGKEIWVCDYKNCSWNYVLRFEEPDIVPELLLVQTSIYTFIKCKDCSLHTTNYCNANKRYLSPIEIEQCGCTWGK